MLNQLWRQHEAARFPEVGYGLEVAGHDLVTLDSTTAGCISTFLDAGTLDSWRLSILGLCNHNLAIVVPEMEGDGRAYFDRLHKMAGLVLETIRDGNQSD
jgi:hypothetical protein